MSAASPLASFHPVVQSWFRQRYGEPSPPQALGWPLIAAEQHCLITAPTGSGKTLAAFLKCLDTLWQAGAAEPGVQVLYISPLKALNVDIERNLQEPLAGVTAAAQQAGARLPAIQVAVRTGDTPPSERQRLLRRPPQVLITTPESLYLLLTSVRSREILRTVRYVIVDEIHALLDSKRGTHLALSLERLEALAHQPPVRIGLTATVRPLELAARFLGGQDAAGRPRPVAVADAGLRKGLDLAVEMPVPDLGVLPDGSIWPALEERLLALIGGHTSTLLFVNDRRSAERLASRLNERAGDPDLARTHHGSLSKESRRQVEDDLKAGRLRCLVATGSLELGIDIGAIDLVVQVESPHGIARGLQRVGRAGHLLGAASKGRLLPKHRGDLVEAAAVARGMLRGQVEAVRAPENCLDVLAQQITAMAAVDEWPVDRLHAVIRQSYPYRRLSRRQLEGVLGLLSGRYETPDFNGLRPRITWDPIGGVLRGRDGGAMLAIRSGGTIPDHGLYAIYLQGTDVKLGEVDEEFAYESHPGEIFMFGTATWRTEAVTHDRILVSPAPGQRVGRLPFWKADGFGRSYELGRQVGSLLREVGRRLDDPDLPAWLQAECALDGAAAANLRRYLWELRDHLSCLPADDAVVLEWWHDELGSVRLALHSPFGARVHAVWGLALQQALRQELQLHVEAVWRDDGILLRFPPMDAPPLGVIEGLSAEAAPDLLLAQLGNSGLLGGYFRMAAERALLLPKHGKERRTPLWLQRLKAKDLLDVARRHPDFPILLEAYREIQREVLDLPGLQEILRGIAQGRISVTAVQVDVPSAAAQGLQWQLTANFLYDGDMPRAERAVTALSLDRSLLLDLLGSGKLRDLLDPRALEAETAELQHTVPHRQARDADELHDLLLRLGDLAPEEAAARAQGDSSAWLAGLEQAGRALQRPLGGEQRWVAAEHRDQYEGALAGGAEARQQVLRRYARCSGPFTLAQAAARYGWDPAVVAADLAVLAAGGLVVQGGFTRGTDELQWVDLGVLERLRRRTIGVLRRDVEPRTAGQWTGFLLRWQGVDGKGSGLPGLRKALSQLQGLSLPASAWEREVLPRRVRDYNPAFLDQLLAGGEFAWSGAGERVSFWSLTDFSLAPPPGPDPESVAPEARRLLELLRSRGASFLGSLAAAAGLAPGAALALLWELVEAGLVSNDTFAPWRERLRGKAAPAARSASLRSRRAAMGAAVATGTGRWSLLPWHEQPAQPDPAAGAGAWATLLLQRYGVLSREVTLLEPGAPGWGQLYPLLKSWELRGDVRQGYFVQGLSGVQFALPAAVESLRSAADGPTEYTVLAATDPANPWGPLLPLPAAAHGRLRWARVASAWLVLRAGEPVLAVEGGGRRLVPLETLSAAGVGAAAGALRTLLVRRGGEPTLRRLEVQWWGDLPASESPAAADLQAAGFERGYRRLVLYPAP